MSRHIFDAQLSDQPLRVTVGYDRPSHTFYMHLGWLDPQTGTIAAYASDLALAYDPSDWRSIRRFLVESLHIIAPDSVWTELAYDRASRTGNRVVRHSRDGTMNELIAW